MQGALKDPHLDEADYLAAELTSKDKHEYVSGQVFAMSGASLRHNQISLNIAFALRSSASKECRVSMADVRFKAQQLYYYPDVMVSCEPKSDAYCESQPCLIVEVLSESTESVDRGEKLHNYQKVPELEAYLLVSQKERRVDVYQRSSGVWLFESVTGNGEVLLTCPRMTLTLDAIYENIEVDAEITRQLA
jgi:Uma2 family endonuclease